MHTCTSCMKEEAEVTEDGFCYTCSNGIEVYPDLETMLGMLFGQEDLEEIVGKTNAPARN